VPSESAEADAEGIEHHVSEVTLKAFAQFLKTRS
jgi:DtxR family manganese transport transcriptional regulator